MVKFDRNLANYCYAAPALYPVLKEHALRMRNNPTEAEERMWQYLKGSQLGKPFRRQHIIADNIVDFVCLPCKLIIEIDGGYHNDIRQQYHDNLRTEELQHYGFRIIRFTNEDVLYKLDTILEYLKQQIQ